MPPMDSERAVTCDMVIEAVSAFTDSEPVGIETRFIEAHLAVCERCARITGSLPRLAGDGNALEVAGAGERSRRLGLLAARTAEWGVSRAVIALAAAQILGFSLIDLVGGGSHEARHLAAFTLAYGLLLATVAFRPARARTALPVAVLLGLTLAITAVVDLLAGRVPLAGEALHLPELVSVLAVAHLAGLFDGPIRSRQGAAARRSTRVAAVPHRRG
jgi:predicted anti-sigma-YlaC factor YlaD